MSLTILCVAGCGAGDAETHSADAGPAAEWSARSTAGVPVRVAPEPNPPSIGRLRLRITVADSAVEAPGLTVDLVSPTMPLHGITRFPATRIAPGRYSVDAEIPMEGPWSIYVNLDDGGNTALFDFDVAAPGTQAAGAADAMRIQATPGVVDDSAHPEPHHAGAGHLR
ncbi:MAG TPA: hypothetical protein VF188_09795 [Longimicrobiales bacterium]